jgi:hypothetical protein
MSRIIEQQMIRAISNETDWKKDNTSVDVIHNGIHGTHSYQKEIQVKLHGHKIARIFPGNKMILSSIRLLLLERKFVKPSTARLALHQLRWQGRRRHLPGVDLAFDVRGRRSGEAAKGTHKRILWTVPLDRIVSKMAHNRRVKWRLLN